MNFEESPLPRFESDSAAPPVEEAAAETVSMQATQEPSEEMVEDTSAAASRAETVLCPFCDAENEKQAFLCSSCQTVLTLSDLEMLISQQSADQDKLRPSVESLERENESYGLNVEQMMSLGIGHVNLKNYRQGFFYLQEAVRMNPSNVLFDAQVNALAIRLAEMEEQQSAHDLMSKNRKILVVDDSPTVRKLISGKLEKCGHEVVCAIDGVDALEKIKELKPDLVLLDITMPRLDGYQVCKMIRSNDSTKDVPVVMISGKDGFFDKVRGRMAGTSGYITKPFGPETLMKTVETYLN
jgi:twitching motility two-component system response regulator PilG